MKVDSAAVVNTGTLSPKYQPYMIPEMTIDLKNKNYLGKHELIILDMLQTNNWQRPIYYAITVSPEQFVRLDGNFQQTGMAYRVVPMDTKENELTAIDTEKMYDNVMNKFKWGGVNTPGIYLDETVMRMCKSYRMNMFGVLVKALIAEGENEKALAALDKCMEVLPPENVPLDVSAIYLGEYYYKLGQKEKAEAIYDSMSQIAVENLNWYFRLRPAQQQSIVYNINQNMAILNQAITLGQANQAEYVNKYKADFESYYLKFSTLRNE
jgi:tetratricopeptide (TPR) repeat protein